MKTPPLAFVAPIVLCASFVPEVAHAQQSVKEELLLLKEESVSIAARHEQPISEAPSNVYVITDEDIRHSGATDIPTVLRRVPGMEVMQITGADFNVSVRGDNQLPANKLLVLVDGRSVYEDAYGSVFWTMLPITLPEIKRIEVLKGPASALYGFNAFDGVINIITKSPQEIKEESEHGTIAQVGAGELGTIRAAGIQGGTYEKLGYRLSVGHDQNQEWRNREALALRLNKFNALTNYAITPESKLVVSGGLVGADRFDGQVFETITESTSNIRSWYANVAYERPNFFIRGWWNQWTHGDTETIIPLISRFFVITDRNRSADQLRQRNTYNLDAQHAVDFGREHRLTYGVNLRNNAFSSNFLLDESAREDRLGFFIQEEWRATDHLTIVAGLRDDLHSEIKPTYSPRVTVLYSPVANHTFRATGAVAYRPPTLFERFINARGTVFPLGCPPTCAVAFGTSFVGNKNSKPEQIISYDVGYQGWFLNHRLRARVDLFYNQISDVIAFQAPTPTNKGNAEIFGGEAGIEFLATSWLTGFANYSYEEFGLNAAGGTTAQRGAPRFKTNAGVRGDWTNGLNGEVAVNYVGSATYPINSFFFAAARFPGGQPAPNTRVGSYVLVNVRAAYQFWHEKAEVAVTAFNALNDKHKEHPLGDEIGSLVMGWLTLRF